MKDKPEPSKTPRPRLTGETQKKLPPPDVPPTTKSDTQLDTKSERSSDKRKVVDIEETKVVKREKESTDDNKKSLIVAGIIVLLLILLIIGLGSYAVRSISRIATTPTVPLQQEFVQNDTTPPPSAPATVEAATAVVVVPPPAVVEGVWEQVAPTVREWEPRGAEVAKVVQWLQHTDSDGTRFWVPLRNQDANGNPLAPGPGGTTVAGFGRTYSVPPEGGGALPPDPVVAETIKAKTAAWTRNERGDWAIARN